ncbi:uroporphyrinogen-III C-methyltransferase [Phosphitispora fastidiosa]|uniref:uroporphyrinogen-III C-methyltransferase n=1 Tax=Phosphitispora fastidiosa TaxID=2837202 RepID=UPI001E37BA4C|nr:uroporphyrinogen-III C-methyltransferase [Phosphitispora fastidiosa]MBU7006731.1 uroporphyrinogen III methyltransferase/synthase [Phosphitispora fastidiosa]
MENGRVYLVGAGPGDPKLITVKGLECIQTADVIVYDRLSSPRLLSHAKPGAELIYAGKSPVRHTLKQDEINRVLVDKAQEGKTVTRLKGGDPFVFGRGGEEAEFLLENNIPFEVVPGITSGIAVPAYAGIPVTHRDFNSTLAIITGNEDPTKEDTSVEWDKVATGCGTIVFYMGMSNLPYIVEKLTANGRPPETPAAVIRWGTRPEQKTVTGVLSNIVEKAREAQMGHPAIIVVGEVVSLREKLMWFEQRPLFGQRVLVTRSRSQASALAREIELLGGEPWEFPTIEITAPEDYGPLDRAITDIDSYDWLVLTSVNGVQSFMNRMREIKKDVRCLKDTKIAAIGPKTREEIEKYGVFCEFMPEEFVAEAIIDIFREHDLRGKRFLLPRADIARKVLPDTLESMGAIVDEVTAYRTVMGSGDSAEVIKMLEEKRIHVLTFTSSSTVKNFVRKIGADNIPRLTEGVIVASIGPITSAAARELGLEVAVEAEVYTIDGLVQAVLDYIKTQEAE